MRIKRATHRPVDGDVVDTAVDTAADMAVDMATNTAVDTCDRLCRINGAGELARRMRTGGDIGWLSACINSRRSRGGAEMKRR